MTSVTPSPQLPVVAPPLQERPHSVLATALLMLLARRTGSPKEQKAFTWKKRLGELALIGAAGYWTSKDFAEYYRTKLSGIIPTREFEGEVLRAQCLAPIEQSWELIARTGTMPLSEGTWYHPLQRRTGQLVGAIVERYDALPPVEQGPWNLMLERPEKP